MVLKVKESSNFDSTCSDAEKIEEEKKKLTTWFYVKEREESERTL